MKYSDMSDEGKRLADGVHGSYDKSNTYREESGKSLQRSKAYSEMASDVHRNSASINSNANQEYTQWLRQQSLPNSKGPMGIHEAEVIMSSRPDMERQYQQSFVEQKVASMTSHLQSGSGPKNFGDIKESYEKSAVNNNVSKEPLQQVVQQGEQAGLGKDFSVDSYPQTKVNNMISNTISKIKSGESEIQSGGGDLISGVGNAGLSGKIQNIENQMADQTEAMEKASKMQNFAKNKKLGG